MKTFINFSIVLLCIFLLGSCQKEEEFIPKVYPALISLNTDITSVMVNDDIQLCCFTTNLDKSLLTYTWSSAYGSFPSGKDKDEIVWKAPNVAGEYILFVEVSDGVQTITDSIIISVYDDSFPEYPPDIDFGEFTDSRDGKTYRTVKINGMEWMAENLAYLPVINNEVEMFQPVYKVYDFEGTSVQEAKKTMHYKVFGALYNWPAAKIACPDGWHLPSLEEWDQLAEYIAGTKGYKKPEDHSNWTGVGEELKASAGWKDNGNGTDSHGFRGLPGGVYHNDIGGFGFGDLGDQTRWWTSSQGEDDPYFSIPQGYFVQLQCDSDSLHRQANWTSHGFSVRCVRDIL